MKNVNEILKIIQHQPQFYKLKESKCISKLKSALLPSIQKNIKYAYIKNSILYFVMQTRLNKRDNDNIINTIKMILNSPMIKESNKFIECKNIDITDVKIYADYKPKVEVKLYSTTTHKLSYKERATGDIKVKIEDEKLKKLTLNIIDIIKNQSD